MTKTYFYYFGQGVGKVYTERKPVQENNLMALPNSTKYQIALQSWLQSGKEVKISPEQEERINSKACDIHVYLSDAGKPDYQEFLKEGIYIEGVTFKLWCDYFKNHTNNHICVNCTHQTHPECRLHAFLEDVKEEAEDLWTEVVFTVIKDPKISVEELVQKLKSKFIITRKV